MSTNFKMSYLSEQNSKNGDLHYKLKFYLFHLCLTMYCIFIDKAM